MRIADRGPSSFQAIGDAGDPEQQAEGQKIGFIKFDSGAFDGVPAIMTFGNPAAISGVELRDRTRQFAGPFRCRIVITIDLCRPM
jgi:hypothetical protein